MAPLPSCGAVRSCFAAATEVLVSTRPETPNPNVKRANGSQSTLAPPEPNDELPESFLVYHDRAQTVRGRLPGNRYVRPDRQVPGLLPRAGDYHVLHGAAPP